MNDQDPQSTTANAGPLDPTSIDPANSPDTASAGGGEALRRTEEELANAKDAYLRARADVENVRRQAQQDVAKAHRYGIERFAESLLPVRDALETALATDHATPESLRAGVELTLKQLAAAFDKAQLTVIDPLGQKFDPHAHQAMAMVDSDQPANTVVQVMQKGYRLNDRVLRPAMVLVARSRENS